MQARKTLAVATLALFGMIGSTLTFAGHDLVGTAALPGMPAPQFTLPDQDGKDVSLKDYAGKIVVLEWTNPQCPFVIRHYDAKTMTTLAQKYGASDVAWLAINSGHMATNADDKAWATARQISYPVLNDSTGKVGKAYGAKNTPQMFVIGKDGTILYNGAIDNNAQGDQSTPTNYVSRALDEVLAGKAVSQPQTKPYGCSVKYAD